MRTLNTALTGALVACAHLLPCTLSAQASEEHDLIEFALVEGCGERQSVPDSSQWAGELYAAGERAVLCFTFRASPSTQGQPGGTGTIRRSSRDPRPLIVRHLVARTKGVHLVAMGGAVDSLDFAWKVASVMGSAADRSSPMPGRELLGASSKERFELNFLQLGGQLLIILDRSTGRGVVRYSDGFLARAAVSELIGLLY